MKNPRIYGERPYKAAVVHGGPGAAGSMAPVARTLSDDIGVIEPFQKKDSVQALVDEMHELLEDYDEERLILIGHPWGAWLSMLFASKCQQTVEK